MSSLFYALSKIGYFFVQPSNAAMILALAGLALAARPATRRLGYRCAVSGVAALAVLGYGPVGHALLLPLEQRFAPPPPAALGRIDGIVVLGGFENGHLSKAHGELALSDSGERLTETVRLAYRLPAAKVVFSGGAGAIVGRGIDAAADVRQYLVDVGIAPERIVIEDRSRNTRENAVMTRDVVKPAPGSRWLLVTSAFHMPRAVGLFRRAGFDVVPWPVDHRVAGRGDLATLSDGIDGGLLRTDLAVKEYIGLAVYRLAGWTDALWPGP